MTYPVVSVIIPTYNYRHYIMEAISSVLQQTYPASQIEIVIVDDGSTDNTEDILKDYIDKQIVHYYYQSNKGKANASRNAIEKCTGKYIFNLDADDYFFPEKIERTVAVYEQYPDVVHVASPARFVNQNNETIRTEQLPEDMLEKPLDGQWLLNRFYNNFMLFGGGSTYSARASVLKPINIPDEIDMFTDELLIIAVLPYGKSFFIRDSLSVWRDHISNYSNASDTKEKNINKELRLLHSSAAVLAYMENNNFSNRVVKAYRLLHATRVIALKESMNTKTLKDIYLFGNHVFFTIKPDWNLIKKYQVLNRLIPLHLYKFIKKVLSKQQ